jgi:hypothetical protein
VMYQLKGHNNSFLAFLSFDFRSTKIHLLVAETQQAKIRRHPTTLKEDKD